MSAAASLVQWTKNREQDIASARAMLNMVRVFRETGTKREDLFRYLKSLHNMIGWVRDDNAMIAGCVAELSLCEKHAFESDCDCVAPF